MKRKRVILLAAGGTGGHLSPALALAESLDAKNYRVILVSDDRCKDYIPKDLPYRVLIYKSYRVSKNPYKLAIFMIMTLRNSLRISRKIMFNKVDAIVSFGGYTSIAANLASLFTLRPLLLHEQNSYAGRLNRYFAVLAKKVACSFPDTKGFRANSRKIVYTGLPVRSFIKKSSTIDNNKFTILILGGSQGANFLANFGFKIFSSFDKNLIKNVKVIQQVRKEQCKDLEKKYHQLGIDYELNSYFHDIADKYAAADLVISRAGAATIAEIMQSEKASILIPFPYAKDNHQYHNANYLQKAGASYLYQEKDMDLTLVSQLVKRVITDPTLKEEMEKNLRLLKQKDKRFSLLDLVEKF